ncbi:hypothetical protein [Spirosoma jeollabukense]
MKVKLMLMALVILAAVNGSQAQSGTKTGQPQGRYPTPTAGGTDATSDHGEKKESITNKPAMGAGSNTLTTAGSGKKSAASQTDGQGETKKGSKTKPRQVNQQAAGVPQSGGSTGKQKNQ